MKYRTARALIKGVAHLPLRVMYGISDLAAFILHRVVKYRVGVVRGNLAMAFPEKTEKERRRIERDFYRHLCDIFVETAKLAHISDREIYRRVRFEGIDDVNEVLSQGKSVVLMLGHFGNWEWVTCAGPKFIPGSVTCEIYHPLRNKDFDRVMLDLRSRFGTENIPMANTVRRLIGLHQEGKNWICGFISDQRPLTNAPVLKHWTDFLGIDTAYVNGGEVIGTKLGAEFFYTEMMPEKRGHYVMRFSKLKPMEDGEENPYSRAFLARLEESIRRSPSSWLWSHNRWKRKREKQ